MIGFLNCIFSHAAVITVPVFIPGRNPAEGGLAAGFSLEADAVSLVFGIAAVLGFILLIIISLRENFAEGAISFRGIICCLIYIAGILLFVFAGDLFTMFIAGFIFSLIPEAGSLSRSALPSNSYKARLLTIVAACSACIIAGIALTYSCCHSLNIAVIASSASVMTGTMNTALALLLTGFVVLTFSVPLCLIGSGVNTTVTVHVLMLCLIPVMGTYAAIRLSFFAFREIADTSFQMLLTSAGAMIAVCFAVLGFAQRDCRRLLLFHSLAQSGYVLAAAGIYTPSGFSAGMLLVLGFILSVFLFAAALNVKGHRTKFWMIVGALCIGGAPPFGTFVSKWQICKALFSKSAESGRFLFAIAGLICFSASLMTFASFAVVTARILAKESSEESAAAAPVSIKAVIAVSAVFNLVLAVLPDIAETVLTHPAAIAAFNVSDYIDSALGAGYAASAAGPFVSAAQDVTFDMTGIWSPVMWIILTALVLFAAVSAVRAAGHVSRSETGTSEISQKTELNEAAEPETDVPEPMCAAGEDER